MTYRKTKLQIAKFLGTAAVAVVMTVAPASSAWAGGHENYGGSNVCNGFIGKILCTITNINPRGGGNYQGKVPEIDPGSMSGMIAVVAGAMAIAVDRRRRR